MVLIIVSSLFHLAIACNALSVLFDSVSVIINLKNSPTNEFLTIEALHIFYKINEFSTEMDFKLLTVSRITCKSNHLYLNNGINFTRCYQLKSRTCY